MNQGRVHRSGLRLLAAAILVISMGSVSACTAPTSTSTNEPKPSASANGQQRSLEKFAACMRQRGWDSKVTGDSVTTHSSQDQQSALNADSEECSKGTVPDVSSLTPAQWQKAYDLQVKTGTCLQKLGFTVMPPSFQVFEQEKGQWNPYVDLVNSGAMAGPDVKKYESKCPQSSYFPGD